MKKACSHAVKEEYPAVDESLEKAGFDKVMHTCRKLAPWSGAEELEKVKLNVIENCIKIASAGSDLAHLTQLLDSKSDDLKNPIEVANAAT